MVDTGIDHLNSMLVRLAQDIAAAEPKNASATVGKCEPTNDGGLTVYFSGCPCYRRTLDLLLPKELRECLFVVDSYASSYPLRLEIGRSVLDTLRSASGIRYAHSRVREPREVNSIVYWVGYGLNYLVKTIVILIVLLSLGQTLYASYLFSKHYIETQPEDDNWNSQYMGYNHERPSTFAVVKFFTSYLLSSLFTNIVFVPQTITGVNWTKWGLY